MSLPVDLDLGRVGVWSWAGSGAPAAALREAVPEIEDLGYGTLWYPEAIGKETFAAGALLLSYSSRLKIAPGISNIYARDPTAMANGARTLAEAFPGRFVLGLGVSHREVVTGRGHDYTRPLPTMRAYLDAMDAAVYRGPEPDPPVRRVLAALGPKMLDLARERTDGAHPYFVPVEHTAIARERLGPDKLLAVEQAVILTDDAERARELMREHTSFYLSVENYRNSMLRLGFEESDLEDGGSDRLADAIIVWGDEDAIRTRVKGHFDAGADHVCIQVLSPGELDLEPLRRLAPALLDL
jgi:probable F420-dependent oxidoreductase